MSQRKAQCHSFCLFSFLGLCTGWSTNWAAGRFLSSQWSLLSSWAVLNWDKIGFSLVLFLRQFLFLITNHGFRSEDSNLSLSPGTTLLEFNLLHSSDGMLWDFVKSIIPAVTWQSYRTGNRFYTCRTRDKTIISHSCELHIQLFRCLPYYNLSFCLYSPSKFTNPLLCSSDTLCLYHFHLHRVNRYSFLQKIW